MSHATHPPFNHTRADGFYDPCPTCWGLMSAEDRLKSVLGAIPAFPEAGAWPQREERVVEVDGEYLPYTVPR